MKLREGIGVLQVVRSRRHPMKPCGMLVGVCPESSRVDATLGLSTHAKGLVKRSSVMLASSLVLLLRREVAAVDVLAPSPVVCCCPGHGQLLGY